MIERILTFVDSVMLALLALSGIISVVVVYAFVSAVLLGVPVLVISALIKAAILIFFS